MQKINDLHKDQRVFLYLHFSASSARSRDKNRSFMSVQRKMELYPPQKMEDFLLAKNPVMYVPTFFGSLNHARKKTLRPHTSHLNSFKLPLYTPKIR